MCRLLGIDIYEVLRFISFIIFHFHSMKVYFTFKTIFDHLLIVNTPWISEFERRYRKNCFQSWYGGVSDVIRGAKFGLSSDFSVCFCLFVSLHPHVNHS